MILDWVAVTREQSERERSQDEVKKSLSLESQSLYLNVTSHITVMTLSTLYLDRNILTYLLRNASTLLWVLPRLLKLFLLLRSN